MDICRPCIFIQEGLDTWRLFILKSARSGTFSLHSMKVNHFILSDVTILTSIIVLFSVHFFKRSPSCTESPEGFIVRQTQSAVLIKSLVALFQRIDLSAWDLSFALIFLRRIFLQSLLWFYMLVLGSGLGNDIIVIFVHLHICAFENEFSETSSKD